MRLERLAVNKIKIFLTSDDLFERGLTNDEVWKDSGKWNQLFHDMVEEASVEFDVDIRGPVAVEIFSLHAQGIIIIITVSNDKEDEEMIDDGIIEMQVMVGGYQDLLYEFQDFEDLIGVSKRLYPLNILGGSIFEMNNRYYLLIDQMDDKQNEVAAALLSEYGNASIKSPFILKEYGRNIVEDTAIETIIKYFL
ncbi:adaptor protein MecA [Neobacillus dielmonensis]|uniref:adaptor protein MecA n=1 Tax=Neobacillus dielmonensis TaxID=1347369 RepID=UPI0005AAD3BB|nr:adaptor protein MecA [Neobacillus dielmonensis]